jgi:hypothetical protein
MTARKTFAWCVGHAEAQLIVKRGHGAARQAALRCRRSMFFALSRTTFLSGTLLPATAPAPVFGISRSDMATICFTSGTGAWRHAFPGNIIANVISCQATLAREDATSVDPAAFAMFSAPAAIYRCRWAPGRLQRGVAHTPRLATQSPTQSCSRAPHSKFLARIEQTLSASAKLALCQCVARGWRSSRVERVRR